MKIGTDIVSALRNGQPPDEQTLALLERVLNSIQLNNIPAKNWPTQNEIDFEDIKKYVNSSLHNIYFLDENNSWLLDESGLPLMLE